MDNATKREKYFLHNGMSCLVKALEGCYTLMDLRNELSVTGKIVQVDGFMNVQMEDAVLIDLSGKRYSFDNYFVQSRNIRYVHIPEQMEILPTIEKQLAKMSAPVRKVFNPRDTFKGRKLMKRNQETLDHIQTTKQGFK